jgi:hypothetical protein
MALADRVGNIHVSGMADNNHDHASTEALGASPDPVALAGRLRREPHPLFPRDDDRPEDRDIQFITFRRRRAGDRLVQNYPEEIPAHEVRSWAQVVAWWGGGEYKALGKNAKHELVAVHPTGTDEWECFDGESKPFTFRNGSPYAEHPAQPSRTVEARPAAPAPTPAAAPAPAPAAPPGLEAQVAVLGAQVSDLVREMRASHAAPQAAAAPPPPASNETILVAMINAQAQTNRDFQVQMQAAAARESENMRAMMTAVLSQRPAEAKPAADPTASALAIVKELKEVIQPAPRQPPMADTIASLKALKEISAPAASATPAAPPSELSELFGGITAMMQAEASKAAVANVTEQAKPSPPEPRSRPRELYRVPGLGVVDLVAPEPPMPPPASLPARAASGLDFEAIKRDPALRARALAELGEIDVSAPPAASPFAPAPPPTAPPNVAVPASAAQSATIPPAEEPIVGAIKRDPVPRARMDAPAVSGAPPTPPPGMPMPLPAQSVPSAPAPVPTAAAPNVAVPTSEPSPLTNGLDIEALMRDPALRARLLAELGSDVSAVNGASPSAPPTMPTPPAAPSAPSAPAPVPTAATTAPLPAPSESTPEPSAPAPGPSAPAPSESTPGPSAPAASDDQRAPIAEPMHTAARGSPVVTEEYRTRAVPSLRTIAGMSRDQQRAALRTLPGLEDEEVVNQIMEFFQLAASMPPELWVECAKRLPANTVRVLVDGPGG